MKRLIVVLAIVLLALTISASKSQSTYTLHGSCHEYYCELCQKKLIDWEEDKFSGIYLSSGGGFCNGESSNLINFRQDHKVCKECYNLFQQEYRENLNKIEMKLWDDMFIKSSKRREANLSRNKAEALKNLLDRAKQIEQELNKLQSK